MKKIKILFLTLITFLLALFAVACGGGVQFDYNIDFFVNGKVVQTIGTDGKTISMPQNPVKEGYTFDGWYWDEGEWKEEFTLNSLLDQPLQEKNRYKVYAKFDAIDVTITYEYNGSMKTKTIKYGKSFELPVPNDKSVGYVFAGWQIHVKNSVRTVTDGNGKSLQPCDFTNCTATPVWEEAKGVVVQFYAGGGEGIMQDYESTEKTFTLPQNTFTKNGSIFEGWQCGEKVYADGETITLEYGMYAFTARWRSNQVTIKYEYNGHMLMEKVERGSSFQLLTPYKKKEGYSFLGWQITDEKGTRLITDKNGNSLSGWDFGDCTATQVWKGISYTIHFISDETTDGSMPSQTITYGEKTKLSANGFVREGYHFIGWADGAISGSKKVVYTNEQEVENLTTEEGREFVLRAVWKAYEYKILFKTDDTLELKYVLDMQYDSENYLSSSKYPFKKTGYVQTGWKVYSGELAGTLYELGERVENLTKKDGDEIVVIPTWELIVYTLEYIGRTPNSSSYILATYELNYFEEHTLIESTFEYEGYYTSKWKFKSDVMTENALNPDYQYKTYSVGETVSGLSVEQNGKIEAVTVWEEACYTMRIHANDGTGETRDYEAKYKSHTSVKTDWMTGKGENYSFAGFYNDNQKWGTYIWDELPRKHGEIIDVYALWKYNYEGKGTVESPYLIDCAEAMENMAVISFADGNRLHFRFTADIDMTGRDFTPIGWYEYSSFRGVIDGNGHTVYGLNIALPKDKSEGLFYKANEFGYAHHDCAVGFICEASGGVVKNIRFENSTMEIDGKNWAQCVGFIAGSGSVSIDDVIVNNVKISVTGTELAPTYSGGEVELYVGGFVGNPKSNTGTVVKNSYIDGEIQVTAPIIEAAGLVTYTGDISASAANIKFVLASVDGVDGTAIVGGLGISIPKAKDCYAVSSVSSSVGQLKFIGASFYEYESGKIENLYYSDSFILNGSGDIEQAESDGLKVADENLKNADWVAENLPSMRTSEWTMEKGYPQRGKRSLETIEISTQEQFLALSGKNLTEKYVLTCDIDMTGATWSMPSVYGEFDGNGHTISNYSVTNFAAQEIALFKMNKGAIKNLILQNVQILAMADRNPVYIGGLVVENQGEIAYCKVSGSLLADVKNGNVYMGGIATINNCGRIYCCYTDCTLEANTTAEHIRLVGSFPCTAYVFGIAQNTDGVIEHCYTSGSYTAKANQGTSDYAPYVYIGGVSNIATNCFSFANLTHECSWKNGLKVWAVAEGLTACSTQTINGVAQSGISENFLKNEGYLAEQYGWKKYVDEETLKTNAYSAWKFTAGKAPTLYFE